MRDPELVTATYQRATSWPVSPNVSPRCSDLSAPKNWRSDMVSQPKPTVVTTIQGTRHQRWNSSQERFYYKRDSVFDGVNVEKSFYIAEDDA